MTGQLESPHFFRTGDAIRATDGRYGTVVEGAALYAIVEWYDGQREEIDQFDSNVVVTERSTAE